MAQKKPLLKAMARPVGFAATTQRWAESEKRAAEYRRQQQEKRERQREETLIRRAQQKKKPRRLWDNFEEIAIIQKSYKLKISISAATRDGFRCVVIREMYLRKEDNSWQYGRKGITIPLHVPLHRSWVQDPNNRPIIIHPMTDFIPAFIKAVEYADTMELADPEKAVYIYPKVEEQQDENC